MFNASPYETAVLSKSTIVPSDHQQLYRDGDTMRFEIPSFMSYVDARQTYLKFRINIQDNDLTNHIRLKLDPKVGAQGVIDRIRIYDGNNTIQLENLENYAERVALTNHYSENQSILAKRELTEGVETTTNFANGQFFNAYAPDLTPVNTVINQNPNSLEICLPLHSGILGPSNKKLFPVELFDGLRMEIDLNKAGKFLKNFSPMGLATDVGGLPWANSIAITTAAPSANLECWGTSVENDETVTESSSTTNMSNIKIGDTVSGITADGLVTLLGTVASFEIRPSVLPYASPHTRITLTAPYAPAAAPKYLPVWTTAGDPLGQIFITTSQYNNNVPRVEIQDVELIVKQVVPPAGLMKQYADAVQTEQGVQIDITTFETYRNNIQASETVSQVQIPSYNRRAKSVLCLPMNNQNAENLTTDNLSTTLDNIKEYQFYINGQPQPTRAVATDDLSKTIPTCNQVALWELTKSLASSGIGVRKLDAPEKHFAIGRSLAKQGGVYNLKDVGGLALKQEYTGAVVNKLLITYVGSLRRLVVNASGKVVEL